MIPYASATGLGLVVSLEPSGETDAESSGRIWGGGEAGTSFTRIMNIQSLSTDTIQEVSFEVNDQVTENDASFIDYGTPSRITDWIVFEPAKPVLNPGESMQVTITFNIPAGTSDGAFNANIRTFSTSASDSEAQVTDAGTQAVLGTRLALDARVWLGVGDALALAPKFDITGVDGALIAEEKFVRVFFENTGISPVSPVGRFQLSDPNFVDRVFEPVDFKMPEIRGGEVAFTEIPVAGDLEDGFFRVFVTAQSGEVRITRLFEAELIFDDPNKLDIPDLAIRIAGFLLAALGLVFGVRLVRGESRRSQEPSKSQQRRARTVMVGPAPTPPGESLETLQAALARVEKQFHELARELTTAAKTQPSPKPSSGAKAASKSKPGAGATDKSKAVASSVVTRPRTKRAAKPAIEQVVSSKAKSSGTKAGATKRPANSVTPKPAAPKPTSTAPRVRATRKKTEN